MRNLQEQVKIAFCYQKFFRSFTVWIDCFSDLKNFANSRLKAEKFFLDQFFLTVYVRTIFVKKYQFWDLFTTDIYLLIWHILYWHLFEFLSVWLIHMCLIWNAFNYWKIASIEYSEVNVSWIANLIFKVVSKSAQKYCLISIFWSLKRLYIQHEIYAIMYVIIYNYCISKFQNKNFLSSGKNTVAFKREEEIMCIRLI